MRIRNTKSALLSALMNPYLRNMRRLTLWFVLAACTAGCDRPDAPDCFKRAGESVVEVRELAGVVKHIELDDFVHLVYRSHEASLDRVVVKAPENLLPGIVTDYDGERLVIRNTNRCNWVRDFGVRLEVEVHSNSLQRMDYTGQGDVLFSDTLRVPVFTFESRNGVGDIMLRLQTDSTSVVVHTGYSDVHLEGSSTFLTCFNQGWGVFSAREFETAVVACNNSSFSDMHVWASDYLYAFIGGRGNIGYGGNPNEIETVRVGSGMLFAIEE
jgi:hypothetical protein